MNAATHFEVKGPAAMHCEALLARQAPARDPMTSFAIFAERLAEDLAPHLKVFLGDIPEAETGEGKSVAHKQLAESLGSPAANLVIPVAGASLLASFSADQLAKLVNAMFGGVGQDATTGDATPVDLPKSVELLARQLEKPLAESIREVLSEPGNAMVRAASLEQEFTKIPAFLSEGELAQVDIKFRGKDDTEFGLTLAIRKSALPRLLAHLSLTPRVETPDSAPSRLAPPFDRIPLPLTATLVDMRMSVRKLSRLKVGTVLPIAIARKVPLSIGRHKVALGTVGELDDRTALQISSVLLSGETQ